MPRLARSAICTFALCLVSITGLASGDDHPDMQRVTQELAALRAEVAELRAQREETWLNERRAEQVKTLIREVLADTDTRAALLESRLTAGHDGKFFIASADGAFRLAVGGNVQLRYIANSREDSDADDFESGFTVRRAEVNFTGYVGSPRIDYFVQIVAHRDTGTVALQDLVLSHAFDGGWDLYGGRTKAPVMREEIVSSNMQQFVDRSLVNCLFSPEYVEGVGVTRTAGDWRISAMVSDGERSGSVGGAGNDFAADAADYALSARGEWKPAGDWKQLKDFHAWSGEPMLLVLGAAVHYEAGETGDGGASGAADHTWLWTADASLERNGFSAFGAVVGRHADVDPAVGPSRDDYALLVQSGYMVIPDKFEPFVRFEWIFADAGAGEEDALRLLTAGANWFLMRDRAKLTFDVVYAFDPVVASNTLGNGAPSGLGLLTDAPGEAGQVVGRAQFQLKY